MANFKCGAKKMSLERVKSKNLFNFRPQGFVDEDIEAYEKEKKALYQEKGLEKLLENASVEDFVEAARRLSFKQYDGHSPFESHAAYVEVKDSVRDAFLRIFSMDISFRLGSNSLHLGGIFSPKISYYSTVDYALYRLIKSPN